MSALGPFNFNSAPYNTYTMDSGDVFPTKTTHKKLRVGDHLVINYVGDVYQFFNTGWINIVKGGASVVSPRKLAQERRQGDTDEYGVAVGEWGYTICTADTVITVNPALVKHVIVTVATATADITIRDAATAGTGTVVDTIPVTTAIQTKYEFDGYQFNSGLVIDFGAGATGTVRVAWRDQ